MIVSAPYHAPQKFGMRDPCDVRQTASAVDVSSLRQLMTATVEGPVFVDTVAYLHREPSGKPNAIQKARTPQVYRR